MQENLNNSKNTDSIPTSSAKPKPKQRLKFVISFVVALVLVAVSMLGFAYLVTPANMETPLMDHSHFRMQYIFMGQAEDFGSPRYQVDYVKDICNGDLTESPIHFHDNRSQFVHLHWQRVSGGQVLKFYGLNKIGGPEGWLADYMGLKIDDLASFKFTPIPIHSKSLPQPRPEDQFWVYTGDERGYQKRNIDDFVNQDLETFFGKNSDVRETMEELKRNSKLSSNSLNFEPPFTIKAKAHAGEVHKTLTEAEQHEADELKIAKEKAEIEQKNNQNNLSATEIARLAQAQTNSTSSQSNSQSVMAVSQAIGLDVLDPNTSNLTQDSAQKTLTEEELKDINNLLGNVVIFVQPSEPSDEQIKTRFNNLVPLEKSACGG